MYVYTLVTADNESETLEGIFSTFDKAYEYMMKQKAAYHWVGAGTRVHIPENGYGRYTFRGEDYESLWYYFIDKYEVDNMEV